MENNTYFNKHHKRKFYYIKISFTWNNEYQILSAYYCTLIIFFVQKLLHFRAKMTTFSCKNCYIFGLMLRLASSCNVDRSGRWMGSILIYATYDNSLKLTCHFMKKKKRKDFYILFSPSRTDFHKYFLLKFFLLKNGALYRFYFNK